jgi:hypothetical protein
MEEADAHSLVSTDGSFLNEKPRGKSTERVHKVITAAAFGTIVGYFDFSVYAFLRRSLEAYFSQQKIQRRAVSIASGCSAHRLFCVPSAASCLGILATDTDASQH